MTKQIHLYRTVSFLLIIILFFHTSFLTASAKCSEQSEQNFIQEDNYRKTLCKGFLGKSYGAVVDGIRCDCSGYTKAALERMNSQNNLDSFKDYYVKARCTNAWVAGSHISFTNGQIIDGSMQWNKKKTTAEDDGRVRVRGYVSGEVSGYIEGEIDAIVDGNVNLNLLSGEINKGKDGKQDEK